MVYGRLIRLRKTACTGGSDFAGFSDKLRTRVSMGRFETCPYDMDIVSESDLSSKPTYVSR